MYIAITQNVVNIIASLGLVYLCGMKVEGVALGDVDCPICRLPDGHCPLDAQLRQAEKIVGN